MSVDATHMLENTKSKGPSHPGGDDPTDIGAFGKGKGKRGKGKHGEGKGNGKQGQHGQDKDKSKDKNKDSVECWNCGKRGHYSKDCWSKENTNKGCSKGKHRTKSAADAHNLDSTKPANAEPEVEIGGFDMSFLDVDALQQQESEGSRLESTEVQERQHGPRVSHTGRSFLAMLTSLSAQQLWSLSSLASDCTLKVATIGESISEFEVFKLRCVSHCLSVGEYTTMGGITVLYGDKCYMFHKGSNVAKKIDAWIQKEMRDSQHHGCTVEYKENNVHNIYMKPKGNQTDAMPLSKDSDNRLSEGVAGRVRTRKTGEIQIQKIQEEHTIQCEMMRWMVKSSWCRGCQVYLLNPVQDRSPNTS